MLFLNFNETVNAAMNELSETNRNIGLLETSISMQSFSAVASETQADAAEMMIRDEDSRKDAIIDHLFELHTECVERMQEVNELTKSANQEYSFYVKEAWENRQDSETEQICQELAEKALTSSKEYSREWENLYELSKQIMATIAGENSPRVASQAVTVDDLPFESATATAISTERFQQILSKVDVIPAVEKYMSRDIDSILSDVNEGFNSAKMCICSAIGSEVWESEELTDTEKEAFELALASHFEEVAEHLKEVNAVSQLPSQRRIDAVYHRA